MTFYTLQILSIIDFRFPLLFSKTATGSVDNNVCFDNKNDDLFIRGNAAVGGRNG